MAKLSLADELQYIYSTLRRLKSLHRIGLASADPSAIATAGRVDIFNVATIFPRKFVLKLLDERLGDLSELADKVASRLFEQISSGCQQNVDARTTKLTIVHKALGRAKYLELDEYFHFSFNSLYDFFIEFDWHEAEVDLLNGSDLEFVKTQLHHFNGYLEFQKTTNEFRSREKLSSPKSSKQAVGSPSASEKLLKSSLSVNDKGQRPVESPNRRRRVRFKDSAPEDSRVVHLTTMDKVLRDSHSIMALKLLVYSMNNLIQCLCNQLAQWVEAHGTPEFKESIEKILESRQKVRTNQLRSLVAKIKTANEVYFNFLTCMGEIKRRYLVDYTLGIICARDEENLLKQYKVPMLNVYITRLSLEVERQVIDRLADQLLQLLADLMVSELTLPPVELDKRQKVSRGQKVAPNRENQSNFITTWLNMTDNLLFGKKEQAVKKIVETPAEAKSTLDGFKSSSRILNQMDNLKEMGRHLLTDAVQRMSSSSHLRYFVELVYVGLDSTFESLAPQLRGQLSASKPDKSIEAPAKGSNEEDKRDILRCVNSTTAKVRCLKFIQIMTSLDDLIRELAKQNRLPLSDRLLDVKIKQFTDYCGRQSGSSFTG